MSRKYDIGDMILINRDNEILDAEVFAHINLSLGNKVAYSLKIGNQFFFVEEKDIIEKE
jgi:hypothetical protein